MNNEHDKTFFCPKCRNKTLVPLVHKSLGVAYGDILICEECAAELKAIPNYDGTVIFEEIEEEEW